MAYGRRRRRGFSGIKRYTGRKTRRSRRGTRRYSSYKMTRGGVRL